VDVVVGVVVGWGWGGGGGRAEQISHLQLEPR